MTEYLLRQRLAESHQEDRPVDGVEADDILADQVHISRPELLVVLIVVAVRIVAAEGDIVGKVRPAKRKQHGPGQSLPECPS